MRILALDAALGPCSAALVVDGVTLAERSSDDPRGASSALPGLAAAVVAEAGGFDAVAVTIGPGSFTGVRAALALAHGLALGAGVPIMGVTAFAALEAAWVPLPGRTLWVALDTRRGRVFLWRGGNVAAVTLDDLPVPSGPTDVAGDAAVLVVARVGGRLVGPARIAARFVAQAAQAALRDGTASTAQPLYVEAPEARPAPTLRPAPSLRPTPA